MKSRANLKVVKSEPVPATVGLDGPARKSAPRDPDDVLALIVPELIAAEQVVARLRNLMNLERPRLAKKRGVAFVREEHVRAEFGCRP